MPPISVVEMIDRPFLGGGQLTVLALAKNLDPERFRVSVCSEEGGPLVEEVKRAGIPHVDAAFSSPLGGKKLERMVSLLRDNKVEILHTHGGVAGFYGRRAARKAKTPVIIHTLHGIHYLHYRNPLLVRAYKILERRFSSFTDAVIVVSEADRRSALENGLVPAAKIVLVKNGIDLSKFASVREPEQKKRELGLGGSQLLIGTVARLHRQKGLKFLLSAVELIRHKFPGLKAVIAGGGELRVELERQCRRMSLGENVVFLGERSDIPDLLSIFEIFVLPSLWEGLPYALIEAAAAGKPIVATDIDGVREIVRDGENGLLVSPGDSAALAAAVSRLLLDKESALRLGTKAKEQIPPQFAISRMISEVQGLYARTRQAKSIKFI